MEIIKNITDYHMSGCSGHPEEYRLINDLMSEYDHDVRPSYNQTCPVTVTMEMTLHQIVELDEKHELLTTSVWQRLRWIDDGLKWNSSHYGGLQKIRLSISRVWRPDVTLVNSVKEPEEISEISFQAVIESTGEVSWNLPRLFISSCQLNIAYFPWDQQICNLQFASWTHDGSEMTLTSTRKAADNTDFILNGEWQLIGIPVRQELFYAPCCEDPFTYLNYDVTLRRRSGYYVENLIFPSVLVTAAGMLVFLLPSESGEKVSLSVTILLATTVYQLLVSDHVPVQSKVLPVLGLYLMVTQVLLAVSMTLSVLVIYIHHHGDNGAQMPECLRKLLYGFLARIVFLSVPKSSKDNNNIRNSSLELKTSNNNPNQSQIPDNGTTPDLTLSSQNLLASLRVFEDWLTSRVDEDAHRTEWCLLAKALDRLFLAVYFVCFMLATLVILTGHVMFRID